MSNFILYQVINIISFQHHPGHQQATHISEGGSSTNFWVESYTISHSLDGVTWTKIQDSGGSAKVFPGNTDRDTPVVNTLTPPVTARYLRLHPMTWHGHISMRWEVSRSSSKQLKLTK